MSLRPICVKCGREMSCEKNGVMVVHPMEHAEPGPIQEQGEGFTQVNVDALFEGSMKEEDVDFVIIGDKYRCPTCGNEIVTGFGRLIMATAFTKYTQEDLKKFVEEAEEAIEIRRT